MAGAGKKTFTAGETLTASDVNTYLMEQSVMYFAGTAARASAIPTPSTGMTSYIGVTGTATIPQLETYTGSQWQTPYGLTQVANVSFSAAASITVDNVFTSQYANYKIVINSNGINGGADPYIQFRVGGVTTVGTGYNWSRIFLGAGGFGTPGGSGVINTSNINIGSQNGTTYSSEINLFAPQLAENTRTTFASVTAPFAAGPYSFTLTGSGTHISSTLFDGFVFTFGTSSTGTCRIYGMRNA